MASTKKVDVVAAADAAADSVTVQLSPDRTMEGTACAVTPWGSEAIDSAHCLVVGLRAVTVTVSVPAEPGSSVRVAGLSTNCVEPSTGRT